MQCSNAQPKISAWLDRELDPLASSAIRSHVNGCEACTAFRDDLQSLDLDTLLAPEPSADFVLRLERKLTATSNRHGSTFAYRATAGALGLAATIAGFSIGVRTLRNDLPAAAIDADTNQAESSELLVRDSIDPFGEDTVEGVLLAMISEQGEG